MATPPASSGSDERAGSSSGSGERAGSSAGAGAPGRAAEAGHPLARTLTPWRLGSLEVPHRVVMGSMHTGLELVDDGGEAIAAFWRERVEGGAALIVTGGLAVSPSGRGAADYAVLGEPATDARLAFAVEAVHAAGGLVSAQLFHAGRYALLDGLLGADGEPLQQVAPSAVPWRAARGAVPRELTDDDVWGVISDYAAAAATAVRLGFDAVEIMASEGYLVNQFCSPLTNLRDDAWGGDAARRRRFALQVLAAVRAAVASVAAGPVAADPVAADPVAADQAIELRVSAGDSAAHPHKLVARSTRSEKTTRGSAPVPVAVRVSGDDLMPGSTTAEEVDDLVRELVAGGVDAISVGVGWHESRVPTVQASVPHGAWLGYAERIAGVVRASTAPAGEVRATRSVAVITSNRMTDLRDAEEVLSGGLIDAVALARPFLADPQLIVRSSRGAFDLVNTCIGCNQACIDRSLIGARVSCLVNPRAGHESVTPLTLTTRPVLLAVVGAGPAGLAAAVDAARRGHEVTLFDAAAEPGGQFGLAARIPGKEDYAATPRSALAELRALGATLRFGEPVTAATLLGSESTADIATRSESAAAIAPGSRSAVNAAASGAGSAGRERPTDRVTATRAGSAAPFDAVIVATGVVPRHIDVPGAELPHVISYEHALTHGVPAGSVAIIGGGGIGVDVAAWLTEPASEADRAAHFAARFGLVPSAALVGAAAQASSQTEGGPVAIAGSVAATPSVIPPVTPPVGVSIPAVGSESGSGPGAGAAVPPQRNAPPMAGRPLPRAGQLVTVLRRSGRFGDGIGISSRWVAVDRLRVAGVRMLGGVRYEKITPTTLDIIDADGVPQSIPADTVIVCAGQESNETLATALATAAVPYEVVGGAKDARSVDAVRATSEGLAAARRLAP
ncbi:FAD-dependent oxidoreductase [Subtercola endophyticus]|uniref:FAD-dependent oxidoreductase n=1 Tax=Subtercola endophyticus TaxID=2895559 RepID=UPI001E3003EC|nr:FAD-dependent oxidoreductase [Subtercola endophyticus]UFS60538.1 FAD-dependent oxidoreductase [Subtercola endophyticus]